MRKRIVSLAILLAFLFLFAGCASPGKGNEGQHLWVLTDNHTSFSTLMKNVAQTFMEENTGVTIQVESIPTDPEEQGIYLERLRTQIIAGQGPDIFLMTQYSPLFVDVAQSMHNGLFLDISSYYDGDTGLNKEAFSSAVMDAGVLNDGRYILPLSFTIPILYIDVEQLEAAGLNTQQMGDGLTGITQIAEHMGREAVVSEAVMLYYNFASFFSEIIDYGAEKVTWSKTDLVNFLSEYRALMTLLESSDLPYAAFDMGSYISFNDFWAENGEAAYAGTFYALIDNLRIAKATETELVTVPIRAKDGSLCATVTNYGAISAGCKEPELA